MLLRAGLFFAFIMVTALTGFAQVRMRPVQRPAFERVNRLNPGARRVEVVKETFIGRRLDLSSEQSKAFWPLYHKYIQDLTAVRILKRENNSTSSPNGTEQIDRELKYDTEILNIRKHYNEEFLKVLPPEKVSELYKSERLFTDEAVKILSERSVREGN